MTYFDFMFVYSVCDWFGACFDGFWVACDTSEDVWAARDVVWILFILRQFGLGHVIDWFVCFIGCLKI